MEHLLQHLYGYKWTIPNLRHAATTPTVADVYVDAFVVGQKYLVPTFYTIAQRHIGTILRETCLTAQHEEVFTHLVRHVYLTHADAAFDLRPLLIRHFTDNVSSVGENDSWRVLLREVPLFAQDVMDALMSQKAKLASELEDSRVKSRSNSDFVSRNSGRSSVSDLRVTEGIGVLRPGGQRKA